MLLVLEAIGLAAASLLAGAIGLWLLVAALGALARFSDKHPSLWAALTIGAMVAGYVVVTYLMLAGRL